VLQTGFKMFDTKQAGIYGDRAWIEKQRQIVSQGDLKDGDLSAQFH